MVFGKYRKKTNASSSTISSYVSTPASRPSLPSTQPSDLSETSDEKIYNPSGQSLPSPPSEGDSGRLRAQGSDNNHHSPPPSQVNVYVSVSPTPLSTSVTHATQSTFLPSTQGQQPVPEHCGIPSIRDITRSSNRNGNEGRPYYKCTDCKKFVTWVDDIGLGDDNPECYCSKPSRRGITNPDKGRKFFYKCAVGRCEFFKWQNDDNGEPITVTEEVAKALRALKIA